MTWALIAIPPVVALLTVAVRDYLAKRAADQCMTQRMKAARERLRATCPSLYDDSEEEGY